MTTPVAVEATALAQRLGLSTSDHAHRAILEAAVADAVADVEAYLGRVVLPEEFTETRRWGYADGWDLTPLDYPVLEITDTVAETSGDPPQPTGYFTVTYRAGIDCRDADKRPILRYITAAAMNDPAVVRLWERLGNRGPITNVSAEGQSVSYGSAAASLGGGGTAGSGAPGALPTLSSLDRWRVAGRRVFVRKGRQAGDDIWPYGGDTFAPWTY